MGYGGREGERAEKMKMKMKIKRGCRLRATGVFGGRLKAGGGKGF